MKNKFLLRNSILVALLLIASINNSYSQQLLTNGAANKSFIDANWKLGVQMWTFRLFTQEEALAKTETAGITYIEAYPGQLLDNTSKEAFGFNMPAAERKKLKENDAQ